MLLFVKDKERDSAGNWRFWITPNLQLEGSCVIRHVDGTWECNCPDWRRRSAKVWTPATNHETVPCDHMHKAYVVYIEMAAKQNEMKSAVAQAVQRVRQVKAPNTPGTTFVIDPKRKIRLDD